eukprot:MONOS_12272.1-p1 / transcript=MONOS_12272.1 / gene=MONOS_12272 / organism=Monocercomonoides_exilis_PA203 / gene_product=unspecified product / transcript_product=unspecified product / location=Mono_scaffold00669:381-1761(-) / protein_length=315 / sequence_SO=supercontig / SO=protein_coding / is_pseudo=false
MRTCCKSKKQCQVDMEKLETVTTLRTIICWSLIFITLSVCIYMSIRVVRNYTFSKKDVTVYWPMGESYKFETLKGYSFPVMQNCHVVGTTKHSGYSIDHQKMQLSFKLKDGLMCADDILLPSMSDPFYIVTNSLSRSTSLTVMAMLQSPAKLLDEVIPSGSQHVSRFVTMHLQNVRICFHPRDEHDFESEERLNELKNISFEANVLTIPKNLQNRVDCTKASCANSTNLYITPYGFGYPCHFVYKKNMPGKLYATCYLLPFFIFVTSVVVASIKVTYDFFSYLCKTKSWNKKKMNEHAVLNLEEVEEEIPLTTN